MQYNLQLEKVITKIKESNAKTICLHLPDGLKPEADKIESEINEQTGADVLIWLGSNFGACDIPQGLKRLGVDLLISWGHNRFHKKIW